MARKKKVEAPPDVEEMTAESKRFKLMRKEDVSGVSGTGHVADGIMFYDGTSVIRWRTMHKSIAIYHSLNDLMAIHGHEGSTTIEWVDQ